MLYCTNYKKSILFSLEYKSRDSYSRLIEFSPKFFYSNLVFEQKVCHVYYCTLVLNLPFLLQSYNDVIVTSIKSWCVLYYSLVLHKMVLHVL